MGEGTIAEASGSFGGLLLLGGHVASGVGHVIAVGFLVGRVLVEVGIRRRRHYEGIDEFEGFGEGRAEVGVGWTG